MPLIGKQGSAIEGRISRRTLVHLLGFGATATIISRLAPEGLAAGAPDAVRIAQNFDIRTWDPHIFLSSWEMTLLEQVYDPLVALNPSDKIVPALAESWSHSKDGLTWTFRLRDGVRFSNGQALTADDVKATLERVQGNAISGFAFLFADLEGVETNGRLQVVLRTKRPLAAFLNNISVIGIIPAAAARANRNQRWEDGIGTGPYKPVERVKGERVVFQANPHHRARGVPKTAQLAYRPIFEDTTRVAAIRNAEIDVATFIPLELATPLINDSHLRLVTDHAWEVHFLGLSSVKPPFDNAKTRGALNYAIDRATLVNGVYGGGQPIASYIVPGLFGYDPSLPANPFNPTRAKELLHEAGYQGQEIDFIVPQGGFDKSREVSEAIVGMMTDVGFKVKMSVIELATWAARRNSGQYGMYIIDTEAITGDPDRFLQERFVNDLTKTGYKNQELFTLIRQAGSELDPIKRADLYKRAQAIMFQEPSSHIFLYVPVHRHLERRVVHGFLMPPTGLWRVDNTSVSGA